MRAIGIGLLGIIVVGILSWLFFIQKVPAGYVGVKVNLIGNDKGVAIQELSVGRHWIGINENLYKFPTFTQTKTWKGDERISFQTKDGMKVSGDVGLTYSIDPSKATLLFQKYREGIDEITNVYLYDIVRNAFNVQASRVEVEAAYGIGKEQMLLDVEERVRQQVEPIGINIERINYVSDLILPAQVTESINAKVQANQMAILRENEIASSIAEANKLREEAKGKSDAAITEAKGDAEAIRLKAEAIRNNPSVITLNFIEKWDGQLSKVSGNDQMMLMLNDLMLNEK